MNRTGKIVLTVLLLLLLCVGLFAFHSKPAQTPAELAETLRQELQLPTTDTVISYAGEFVLDGDALLWFSIQQSYRTDYRAIECQLLPHGKYRLKAIRKPTAYAKDIVHVVWKAKDVVLINNPDCRSIAYQISRGSILTKTELSPADIPYVFSLNPPFHPAVCDFLDAAENPLS